MTSQLAAGRDFGGQREAIDTDSESTASRYAQQMQLCMVLIADSTFSLQNTVFYRARSQARACVMLQGVC